MHSVIFDAFDRLCRERGAGGDVLEIGAMPSSSTLLCLPSLRGARTRIGVNLAGEATFDGFRIIGANANALTMFDDASFDTVLANSMLEHDPRFWLTLAEMRRVARPDALIAIGVPAYTRSSSFVKRAARVPPLGRALRLLASGALASTPTLVIHDYPGDYYRFSPQAMREVLLEGLEEPEVLELMTPPRLIGSGRMPWKSRVSAV